MAYPIGLKRSGVYKIKLNRIVQSWPSGMWLKESEGEWQWTSLLESLSVSGRGESDRETVGKIFFFFWRNRKWRIEGKAQDPGGTRDNTKDQEEPGRPQLSNRSRNRVGRGKTGNSIQKHWQEWKNRRIIISSLWGKEFTRSFLSVVGVDMFSKPFHGCRGRGGSPKPSLEYTAVQPRSCKSRSITAPHRGWPATCGSVPDMVAVTRAWSSSTLCRSSPKALELSTGCLKEFVENGMKRM